MRAIMIAAAALGAVLALPTAAAAEDAAATLKRFGLLGVFSRGCGQPATLDNPFTHYVARADGTVKLTYDAGVAESSYIVNSATIISPTVIRMNEVADDGSPFQILLALDGDRIRVIESRDPDSGRMYIAGAMFARDSRETAWEKRCR